MLQGTIHCINVIFRPTFKVLKKSNTFQDIETDYLIAITSVSDCVVQSIVRHFPLNGSLP